MWARAGNLMQLPFPIRGMCWMWRESQCWSALSLYWFRGRSADADLQTQPSHDDEYQQCIFRSSSNDDMGNAKSESHDDQLSLMSSNGPYQCLAVSVERDGHRLASSGDGGVVQLWKTSYDGQFQCVSQIQGDLTALPRGDDTTDRFLTTTVYCRARSYI
jgi:WD40 repeat protein